MSHRDRAAVTLIDDLLLLLAVAAVGAALWLGLAPAPLLPLLDTDT